MTGPSGPNNQKQISPKQPSSGIQRPELRYLAIGRIVKAHGVRGEVSVTVLTDFPERFASSEWVFIGDEFEADAYRLVSHRWHMQNALLTLAGVTDRLAAEKLQGKLVQVPIEAAMPLSDGDFYRFELVGLDVYTVDGNHLGIVDDVLETGANDVLVVKTPTDTEILLPSIPDVIKEIDWDANRITVELLAGLI